MKKCLSIKSKLCALVLGCLIMVQGLGQIAFADTAQPQLQDYELSGRDYIKLPSEWKGNSAGDGILQTNIYPDSEPLIKRIGNTSVIVWLADDAARNSVNRTRLMYSVQTKSGGTWSSPLPVDNDETADFYPNLATDGTDIFVTWQNVNKEFGEADATLEKLSQASEIKVSKFNKLSNGFEAPVKLTDNNVLDQTPVAAVANGKAYVSWVTNDANDLFGIKGKSSIMYSQYDGTEWKPAKKVADSTSIIISTSAAAISGKLYLAYSMDTDKKLETLNDREIYYAVADGSNAVVKQLTQNNVIDSKPEMIARNNKASVFWYQDKKIKYTEDISNPTVKDFLPEPLDGYNDNFKVAFDKDNICLMWTRQIKGSIEVFGAFYDTTVNEMTDIVKLTDTKQRIISFDGVYDTRGELNIVCNKAAKIEKTLDGNTYYESGLSDLYITKIAWETNGCADIASTDYNQSDFYPGKPMPISFDFKNIGNRAIKKLVIEAYDGNPFNGGRKLDQSTTVNGYIKPGSLKNITVNFTPKEARKYDLYLKVVVDDNADIDMTDNIIYADMGYCDIVIDKLNVMGNGDSRTLVVTVKNTSNITANDVRIAGKEDSVSGKDIFNKGPFVIKGGQQQQIICAINTKNMEYDKDGVKIIHIVLTTTSEERYTSNNTTSFMLTKRQASIPLEVMVLGMTNNKDKISVDIAVGNVYSSKITGNVIAELCEKTGDKVLETRQKVTSVDTNRFNYMTLEFSKNAPYTGCYYLRLNIAKAEGSTIPAGITKLCSQLVFDLPVYQDSDSNNNQNGGNTGGIGGIVIVPDPNIKDAQQPGSNAKISSLKVNKGTLSPAFDKNTALYDLTLDNGIKEINISASTDDAKALLIIDGVSKSNSVVNYPLSVPNEKTRLEIKVKAENGDIKTYVINIKRTAEINDGKKPSGNLDQFSDITGHWAKDYILSLAKLGIMSGYPDKTFKPDNKITRAEAAIALIKIFNQLPAKDSKLSFSDEAKIPSWSYGYIKTAVDKGWIKGYEDKTFKANNLITRQEFTAMFLRAMGYKDLNAVKTSFTDDANIGSWAKGYVAKAVELGLIGGYKDKTFKPGGNITRAEVCVIANKYLDKK